MLKLILIEPMKEFHSAVKDEMEDEFVKFKLCAPGADLALFQIQRDEKERNQQELKEKMLKTVSKGILKDVNEAKNKPQNAQKDEEPVDPNAMPEWGEKVQTELPAAQVTKPKVEMGKSPVPELDLSKKDAAPAGPGAGSTIATISPGKSSFHQPSIQQTEKTLSPRQNPVVTKEQEKPEPSKALGAFLKGKFGMSKKK